MTCVFGSDLIYLTAVYLNTSVYICVYSTMYVYINICVYMYIYICICTYVYIYIYVYVYVYTRCACVRVKSCMYVPYGCHYVCLHIARYNLFLN